jgi:hypothetical protein
MGVATTKKVTTLRVAKMTKIATTTLEEGLQLSCWEGTCGVLFPQSIVSTKGDNILKMHMNKYLNGMLSE